MKKLITATLLLAGITFSAYAASAPTTPLNHGPIKTIRFGTEATYPPFEFSGSDNTIQGFDIDLANAICKQMTVTCTFTNQAFDSLIPSLRFKRIDAIISGMDITEEREKQVLFTQPYYSNSALFIIRKDELPNFSLGSNAKVTVGVQNGTTHQKYLSDKKPNLTIKPYDSYQNAILDLKNGRIDAVFGDSAVVNEWLKEKSDKKNPPLVSFGDKVTDKDYFGIGLGIAVRQDNTQLQQQLNAALDQIKKDGTYKSIYDKWFKQVNDNNE